MKSKLKLMRIIIIVMSVLLSGSAVLNGITLLTKNGETPLEIVEINFESNSDVQIEILKAEKNTKIAHLETPTRRGYTFLGWYLDEELKNRFDKDQMVISEPLKLYAKWEKAKYFVFFESNGGTSIQPHEIDAGDNFSEITYTPTRDGYIFDGWYLDEELQMPFSASRINNHTTFYAKWRLSSVTITFESKGGGDFESITTSTNEVITNLPIPVRDGYTFLGWYDELIPDTLYLESITVKRSHNLIAKWAKNSVQVSFDTNGGNTIAPISAYFGEQLSHIEPAYKEGFKFKAWYLDEELTIPLETDYVVQEDITLYAAYESIKRTVSFYSHGDNVFSDIYVDDNEKIDKLPVPTRNGYDFLGWFLDSELQNEFDENTKVNSNLNLYAKWEKSEFTIIFNTNIPNFTIPSTVLTYLTELVVNPIDYSGYVFRGWYLDSQFNTPFINGYLVQSNVILHAKWDRIEHTLSFNTNGGSVINSIKVYDGNSIPNVTQPTKVGYRFDGFYLDETFQTQLTNNYKVYNDLTLYVKWDKQSYTIQYIYEESSTSVQVLYGDPIPQDVNPTKTGYTFTGWYENNVLFTGTTMPARNIQLTARFVINQYEITFDANGGNPSPLPEVVTHGSSFRRDEPLSKKPGYTLEGWYLDLNNPQSKWDFSQNHVILSDMTLYARWIPNERNIQYYLDENTFYAFTTLYYQEAINHLSPQKEGYTFLGWYEDDVLFELTTMPDRNIRLYAKWTIKAYDLIFEYDDLDNITYDFGQAITLPLPTPSKEGLMFSGWYLDEALTQPFNLAVMPSRDVRVYSKWTINEKTIGFQSNGGSFIESIVGEIGDPVVAPQDPVREGYDFEGWYEDVALTIPHVFSTIPAEGILLYAKWTATIYDIVFVPYSNDYLVTLHLPYQSEIPTLPIPSKEGYVFSGWYLDEELTNLFTDEIMPSRNITLYAKWEVTYYKLAFESIYRIPTIIAAFGEEVSEPEAPTKEGYSFAGWYEDINFSKPFVFTTMPNYHVYLYAKWLPDNFEISFIVNGGSAVNALVVPYQSNIILNVESIKEGHTFGGWYLDSALTMPFNYSIMPASNLELYAKWFVNEYEVTFIDVDVVVKMFDFNQAIDYTPVERIGYRFVGWFIDEARTIFAPEVMPAEDLILYSKFEINTYTITYNSNGGTIHEPLTGNYDTQIVIPTPLKEGHTFMGWFTDVNFTNAFSADRMPAANTTLYAKWQINTYRISFSTSTTPIQDVVYAFNQDIQTLPILTRTGYDFKGWYLDQDFEEVFDYTKMPSKDLRVYAKFEIKSYTINFISNGGTVFDSYTSEYETPLNLPNPVREGYRFEGWYTDAALNHLFTSSTMPATNITLHAKWRINVYRMSFSTSTTSIADRFYEYNDSIEELPTLTRTGYTFLGWYLDSNYQAPYNLSTMPSNDVIVYAKWRINTYTITFESNGGSHVNSITREFDMAITEPSKPTKAGHVFRGWYNDPEFTEGYNFIRMGSSDLTLYAKWEANSYKITFRSNVGILIPDRIYEHNDFIDALPVLSEYGNTFLGWFTPNGEQLIVTSDTEYRITSDISLSARWEKGQYTITFEENGGSNVADITALYNDAIIAPENPSKENYQFVGWFIDEELTTSYLITRMPGENITLYAKWDRVEPITITYHKLNGELIEVVAYDVTEIGNEIEFIEVTRNGYTFDGWFLDESFTKVPSSYLLDSDMVVYAKWTANMYTITFELNGGTGQTKLTQAYDTIAVQPQDPTRRGYAFTGWHEDENLSTPYVFGAMPDEHITIYASWAIITYELSYENLYETTHSNPDEYQVTTPTITLNNPTNRHGYTFVGWYDSLSGGTKHTTIAVDSIGNKTLYARWEAIDYTIMYHNLLGSSTSNPTTYTIESLTITLSDPSNRIGYTFIGWYDSLTGGNEVLNIPSGRTDNITVYARWELITYTIDYQGTFTTTHSNPTSYDIETDTFVLSEPTERVGYSFAGWYDDEFSGYKVTQITKGSSGNKTLYARWNLIPIINYVTQNNHYYLLENDNVLLRIEAQDDDLKWVMMTFEVGSTTYTVKLLPNEINPVETTLSHVLVTYDVANSTWLITITSDAIKDYFMNETVDLSVKIDDQFGHNVDLVIRTFTFDVYPSSNIIGYTPSGIITVNNGETFIYEIEIDDDDLAMIRIDTNYLGRITAFADTNNPYGNIANENRLNSQGIFLDFIIDQVTGNSKLIVTFSEDATYYLSTMDIFEMSTLIEDWIGNQTTVIGNYQIIYN